MNDKTENIKTGKEICACVLEEFDKSESTD